MASVNKAIILGNVGQDPEIRALNNGNRVANLSIATSESWKDKATGERKERTEWHRVIVFNDGLVGVIEQYVRKGTKLYIEGQIQTRKWTDKDGNERYSTEIVLQNYNGQLVLLGSKDAPAQSAQPAQPTQHEQAKANGYQADAELNDEIPFACLLGVRLSGIMLLQSVPLA